MKRSRSSSPTPTAPSTTVPSPTAVQTTTTTTDDSTLLQQEPCWKCKGHGRKTQNHLQGYTGKICPVCQGTGRRTASQRSQQLAMQPGKIIPLRGKNGHFAGVPAVCGDNHHNQGNNNKNSDKDDTMIVKQGELLAPLGCGDWRIFQLANGHKLTVDDFVCAWVAAKEMRQRGWGVPTGSFGQVPSLKQQEQQQQRHFHHADIGCGCGSVLMMMAWAFPNTIRSHGVEAQQVSYDLCRRGLLWNLGTDGTTTTTSTTEEKDNNEATNDNTTTTTTTTRVQLSLDDLRTWKGGNLAPYDVITGTPPYFPKDRFVASENHAQKIRCRVPTRGAASDYVIAASKLIRRKQPGQQQQQQQQSNNYHSDNENGIICIVETARQEAEMAILETISQVDLTVLKRVDVITRTGLPPRFSCWVLKPSSSVLQPSNDDDDTITNNSNFNNSNSNQKKEKLSFPIETLTIRSAENNNARTLEYVEAMESMGWVDFENTREKLGIKVKPPPPSQQQQGTD